MQRRSFLGTVAAAAMPLPANEHSTHGAFNRSGLTPAEFKRRWLQTVPRSAWVYQPTSEIEPFLDWYPGDSHVKTWTLAIENERDLDSVQARSFRAEAERRGKQCTVRVG